MNEGCQASKTKCLSRYAGHWMNCWGNSFYNTAKINVLYQIFNHNHSIFLDAFNQGIDWWWKSKTEQIHELENHKGVKLLKHSIQYLFGKPSMSSSCNTITIFFLGTTQMQFLGEPFVIYICSANWDLNIYWKQKSQTTRAPKNSKLIPIRNAIVSLFFTIHVHSQIYICTNHHVFQEASSLISKQVCSLS